MGAEVVLAGDSYADAQAHCDGIVADPADVRAPVRRSAGDRRPGHDRQRDPAAPPRQRVGHVRAGRRRRAHRRHRRLHQGAPARRADHRRRAVRGGRDVSVAGSGASACARSRRHLRRRRGGARGRRDHLSDRAETVDEIVRVIKRRDLRRDQGHLRRHANDHGAGRRARRGRAAGSGSSATGVARVRRWSPC